jgi:hypothetical protein
LIKLCFLKKLKNNALSLLTLTSKIPHFKINFKIALVMKIPPELKSIKKYPILLNNLMTQIGKSEKKDLTLFKASSTSTKIESPLM